MSLPYDGTPPPDERVSEPSALDRPLGEYTEPSALDRPLDDYEPARGGVLPDHVQSLMGRMSKGKVYLLEESLGVSASGEDDRIRRDPRLAQLAEQLDTQDPTEWLEAVSAGASSPILHQVLWLQSDLIKHLSTSKVFSWATGLGAGVMGIEWLNDTTLELLFPTAPAALLGLSVLAKAGFDPGEGDDPLLERAAHTFPLHLLPTESKEGVELLAPSSETVEGEVRRKGRGGFASGMSADTTSTGNGTGNGSGRGATAVSGDEMREWNLAQGIDPNARVAIRYATEADKQLRQQAKQSEWYRRHGRTAGKERAAQSAERENRYEDQDSWSFRGREGSEMGGGRDFAKRIGRERRAPYDRRGGRERKDPSDLDRELDGMVRRRAAGEAEDMDMDMDVDADHRRRGGGGGRGRGQRRERRGVEDLDKELDDLFAARTADR